MKTFSFFGTGMSPNDIVKFVGPGTSTDDACTIHSILMLQT